MSPEPRFVPWRKRGRGRTGRGAVDDLLPLALSRPHEALARARAVLAARPGPYEASVAHQAAGIVLRDIGDVDAGVRELRDALRLARRTGSPSAKPMCWPPWAWRWSSRAGRRTGWPPSTAPCGWSGGVLAGRVLHRRGIVLWTLGRYPAALDDVRHAVGVLRRADDPALDGSRAERPRAGLPGPRVTGPGGRRFRGRRPPVRQDRPGAGSDPYGAQPGRGRLPVRRPSGRAGLPRRGGLPLPAAERADAVPEPRPVRRAAGGRAGRARRWPKRTPPLRDIEQSRGRSTEQGRTAADGGQLRAGRGAAAGRPGPGPGRVPPLPVSAERLVAGPRRAACWSRPGTRSARCRPGCCARRTGPPPGWRRSAPATRHAGAPAGRADGAGPRPPRRRRPASGRRGPEPAARPGDVAGQRLARRGAAGRGRGRAAPDAGRLPPRARRPGRAPVHPGRLGTAGAGHRARRRAGRARAAPCRAGAPAAAPADLERALAGHRAGRSRGAAVGRRGAQRQPGRAARGDQRGWTRRGRQGRPAASLQREQQRLEGVVRASALRARGTGRAGPARRSASPTCSTSSARPS